MKWYWEKNKKKIRFTSSSDNSENRRDSFSIPIIYSRDLQVDEKKIKRNK